MSTSPESREHVPNGHVNDVTHRSSEDEVVMPPSKDDESDIVGSSADEKGGAPQTKRRRVTRACDECRRKKIKCDGAMPCTHCAAYSYECTYDKPSNRRRNPAPQYTAALESRLQRAETLLRKYLPDVDLSDPTLDPLVQREFRNREKLRNEAAAQLKVQPNPDDKPDPQIISMIETVGQLDLTESGGYDFRGTSSSSVFLRRMKDHFGGLMGPSKSGPFLPRSNRPPGIFNLDSPQSPPGDSPHDSVLADIYDLPPRSTMRSLSYCSLMCATCLLRFVHQPSYYEQLDRLYERSPETYGPEDHKFLALLYAVAALGCMYNVSEENQANPTHYVEAIKQGMMYSTKSRYLLQDITECQDLTSLQALLFLILFLQVSANLSGCYTFLGMALRSALRMGLHRHLPHAKFDPIESETRRRLFWSIRQVDILVSALLGFPVLLSENDIDQLFPTEVDDEYITKDAILAPPPNAPGAFIEAANAQSKLINILAKIIKHIYPVKGMGECDVNREGQNTKYMISYQRVKELEDELQDWLDKLPPRWRPSSEGPMEVFRPRTLLRFIYAHCQMMLYRPFLHYISPRLSAGKTIDDRYYAAAAAGISVSRNIIHIATEIRKNSHAFGPFWTTLLTQFVAILSLVFYTLENQDKPGTAEIFADAIAGREMIASMANRSSTADRITNSLDELFNNLPEKVKKGNGKPKPTKKRSAPALRQKAVATPPSVPVVKAETFPDDMQGITSGATQTPMKSHQASQQQQRHYNDRANHQAQQPQRLPSYPPPAQSRLAESGVGTPDDQITPSSNPQQYNFPSPVMASETQNDMYSKLDAIMFSAGDPFAYPNPPVLSVEALHQHNQLQHQQPLQPSLAGPQATDPRQFYNMQALYGDIEGQLLGPVPPYLQQSSVGPSQSMTAGPESYLMQQQSLHGHLHGQLPQQQQQQQQQQQHHHQAQQSQTQQRPPQHMQTGDELDNMIANAVSRGDWSEFWGGGQR